MARPLGDRQLHVRFNHRHDRAGHFFQGRFNSVVIEDDAIAVRHMMYLCLSFDHRILDGAGAGGFLQSVRTKLQSYERDIDVY